jgi:hypothetical protein
MKNRLWIFFALVISTLSGSCDKEKDINMLTVCDDIVLVDKKAYTDYPKDHLTIQSAEITGNCLKITFASGGCDGRNWEVKLIDSGTVLYSDPPQRNLRLSLKNNENCMAYIGKTISFDISELQAGGHKVLLNLTNSGKQLLYQY